jgi:hypothetical protein
MRVNIRQLALVARGLQHFARLQSTATFQLDPIARDG